MRPWPPTGRTSDGRERPAGRITEVGVVGPGRMGLPIAANLVDRGFTVTGHRRSGGEHLVAAGGRAASSPAEVAAASDVVVTLLPSALADAGVAMLDCAISGTPGMVAPRLATVLASGEPAVLKRARPVLEAVGPLRTTGASGSARGARPPARSGTWSPS